MFLKYIEWLDKQNNLKVPQVGIVKDNDDPKKLGRIKCVIQGLLEGLSIDSLPWIYPYNPYGQGGRVDLSEFQVPEVDTEVVIEFQGSIYHGYYKGYFQSERTHQTLFDENYPDSYGSIDSTISWWRVNKSEQYSEYYHVSGTTIRIDKDGNLYIHNPGNVDWNIGKSLHLKIGEDFIIDLVRDRIEKITGDCIRKVTGTVIEDLEDDFIRKIAGNLIENVTVDIIRNIGEDVVQAIGQDKLENIARDYLVEATRNLLNEVGINLIQNVGKDAVLQSENLAQLVSKVVSVDAGDEITHNAAAILHNSGSSHSGIVTGLIPSKIAEKQGLYDDNIDKFDDKMDDHDTNMTTHTNKEQSLTNRITALEDKVQELTDLADSIKAEADAVKAELQNIN